MKSLVPTDLVSPMLLLVAISGTGGPLLAQTLTPLTPISASAGVNSADAPKTIDNDLSNYWQAAASPEACITFDLGQVRDIGGIRETSGGFPANPFTLFLSADAVTFIPATSGTLTHSAFGDHLFPLTPARFINMCIQRTDDTGFGELVDFRALVVAVAANQPPTADAGLDQAVDEGSPVTLDGSGSADPDGNPLVFAWTQIGGPTVALDAAEPAHPTFVAPYVGLGGATLTFELRVTDDKGAFSTDLVDIGLNNVNKLPVADAGADTLAGEASLVTLDGTASFDPDRDPLTFHWEQLSGPPVALSDSTSSQPSFTAPLVGLAGDIVAFRLTVSDLSASSSDQVDVRVENVNHPPVAQAGTDQTVNEGGVVFMDGRGSSDADGDPLTYLWEQTGGGTVALADPAGSTTPFTAPAVPSAGDTLTFRLVVSDGALQSLPDEVVIRVLDRNDPPACGYAAASPDVLWPPNQKFASVAIVGVTDPNSDQVAINVTGVTQDEPVNGVGDGDSSPDAVLQGSSALLRGERSGTGDGRMYRVAFTVTDGQGGACSGSVKVCVPHARRSGCIDSGHNYDSLKP